MEEWGHADDRVIQRQYSEKVCMSCAWFTYGIDAHCHTCVGCALMEALLEQGQHLTHGCRNWKPVHQMETGPAVAARKSRAQFPPQPGLDANQVVLKLDLARPVVTQFWLNCSAEYMS